MKNIIINKGLLLLTLFVLCPLYVCAQGSGDNRLFVKDFEGAAGKSINVPFFLTNTDDIVAVQFDVALPYAAAVQNNNYNAALSLVDNRCDGHVASMKPLGNNRYTVVLMSLANRAVKGNLGHLLNIAMSIAADAQPGETADVKISNIVLCKADGTNVASESEQTAQFTVQRVPTPDLMVASVEPVATELMPGKALQLKYVVSNIGDAETGSGWTENIYLEDADGERFFAGSTVYGYKLNSGETVNRTVEVILPEALAVEGEVQLFVEIVNNSLTGEILADRGNNSAYGSRVCMVGKKLFLKARTDRIAEGGTLSFTLTRSGYRGEDETFSVTCDNEGMLTFDGAVTIGKGTSGASFTVKAPENSDVNTYVGTTLRVAAANGYDAVSFKVEIVDNDDYPLTLSTDKVIYTEGEDAQVSFTVERGGPLDNELKVALSNSAAARFSLLRAITIPAGESSATAVATIKDNLTPQQNTTVTFTASAAGYTSSKRNVVLNDNDRPNIKLTLSTNMVSEDAGYGCVTGTITRDGDLSEGVSVKLDNSSNGEVYFDADRVIIPAGSSKVSFPIGVTDNATISGTKKYSVWAALYMTDCKCAVGSDSPAYSSAELSVTDNDAEYRLSFATNAASVAEGGETTVTITRNDEDAAGNLLINLTVDDATVAMPESVTIPSGSRSAQFKIAVPANSETADERYFTVKAAAEGYEPASVLFAISDKSLPDYNIKSVSIEGNELIQGREFTLVTEVENCGLSELAAGMRVSVYVAEHSSFMRGFMGEVITRNELLGYVYTPEVVSAGETKIFKYKVKLSSSWFGTNYIITMADTDNEVEELSAGRNTSHGLRVNIVSPFKNVELSADKDSYVPGEVIAIEGYSPTAMEGDAMEIYLYNTSGDVRTVTTKTAVDGTFAAQLVVAGSMGGSYSIGARAIGEDLFEELDKANVCSMSVNGGAYFRWDVTQNIPVNGELTIKNMSAEDVTDVHISLDGAPDYCSLVVDDIPVIGAGKSVKVNYTLTAANVTGGSDWVRFSLTAECAQGAKNINDVYFYCRAAKPQLSFAMSEVNTTLMRGGTRTFDVKFTNTGSAPTGDVSIEIPTGTAWLGVTTPTSIASLDKGESAAITLQFVYRDGMIVDGVYESYVRVKGADGGNAILPVKITLVGTEEATLTVDAVDIFTKADETGNGPHVEGAKISLVNKMTGETALTGVTDADGTWTTTVLKEGVYDLYVQADGHKRYGETIIVGPGETLFKEVFLDYQAVTVTYTVEETEIVEEYETRLELVFVPDIPQAVLVADEVHFGNGGTAVRNIKITNRGKLTAYNPYLLFPKVEGITFTVLSEYPAAVYPNETFEVKVQFDGPEELKSAAATAKAEYGFKLAGVMYDNSDPVLLKWGKGDDMPFILGGGGFGYDEDSGSGGLGEPDLDEENDDNGGFGFEDEPVVTWLPTSKHSQVVLEFRQTFFLTRQAFNGTLTIDNAQEGRLRDIVFEADVKTMEGEDVSDLFAIEYEKPTGVTVEDDGTWSMDGLATGVAHVLYVPSKETAPAEPVKYLFGGKLSYTDVATGKRVSMNLMQTCLTVNPSPDLYLTYFVQREFISDDPLTDDIIEPWEPAEFALLIQNKGAGKALDLSIETTEPKIIENVNNLPVSFHSLYSSIDGVEGNFPFTKMDVGAIDAGQSVLARWFFYSNVSGYVADYYAELTKGSVYGDEFNLITVLGAKDLMRSVRWKKRISPAKVRSVDLSDRIASDIFLLDEIEDDENLPDHVADAEGNETADLNIVSENTLVEGSGYSYTVTVNSAVEGWAYARLHDPTNGELRLKKVVRTSDGMDMSGNFWQTDRTMMKDRSVLYEYNLHLADYMAGEAESYTLTFEDRPAEPLRVDAVEGVPEGETAQPVTSVAVIFSKPVDAASFDAADIDVSCNGTNVPADKIVVSAESDTRFVVDWSAAEAMYGKYTFALFASGIDDKEGAAGVGSVTRSWNQMIDGNTMLNIEVVPAAGGAVTPQSGEHKFGYVTLAATAAEGYKFHRWSEDGKEISAASMMNHLLYKSTSLKAEFVPKNYKVSVEYNAGEGYIGGAATGEYEYGSTLTLYAVPAGGYLFAGWMVNGAEVENASSVLSLIISGETVVEALFVPNIIDYIMGDVNGDSKVSVTDIVKLCSFIMENDTPTAFAFLKGDMNVDNTLSITDVVRIARAIVGDEALLSAAASSAAVRKVCAGVIGRGFEACVGEETSLPVALDIAKGEYVGVQMDVLLPAGMEITAIRAGAALSGFEFVCEQIADNRWRLLGYSMTSKCFGATENMLDIVLRPSVNVPSENCSVELCDIKLVDTMLDEVRMESVSVDFVMGTTGVEAAMHDVSVRGGDALYITAAEPKSITIYAPDGRAVRCVEVSQGDTVIYLERGVYMVCGTKVIIK